MKTLLATVAVLLLAGCGTEQNDAAAQPATFTVRGSIAITGDDDQIYTESFTLKKGAACRGTGGYDDMNGGVGVTIRDSKGESIALGGLTGGVVSSVAGGYNIGTCSFKFVVEDVPIRGDIYSVEVGSRGEVEFSRADAGSLKLSLS